MAKITSVNDSTLPKLLASSILPVLVDFGAAWCGPCKMLDPAVEKLAESWEGKITVVKVDVDESPNLAMQYQVKGVPTLILFKSKAPVERTSGLQPLERLVERFRKHL